MFWGVIVGLLLLYCSYCDFLSGRKCTRCHWVVVSGYEILDFVRFLLRKEVKDWIVDVLNRFGSCFFTSRVVGIFCLLDRILGYNDACSIYHDFDANVSFCSFGTDTEMHTNC